MQRLPEAMAAALNRAVITGKTVVGVEETADLVEVACSDDSRYRADALIATAPLPALRNIRIHPPLPPDQQAAINSIPYHAVTMSYFEVRRRFWEEDGLPPNIWGDAAAERFFAQRLTADGAYSPDNPITSFIAYSNGAMALRLDELGTEAGTRYLLEELARIRPAIKGALQPVTTVSWQRDSFAGGAYASWGPGQVTRFAHILAEPRGRLFFAGTHSAIANRGMEGALESGERAALEVLATLY